MKRGNEEKDAARKNDEAIWRRMALWDSNIL